MCMTLLMLSSPVKTSRECTAFLYCITIVMLMHIRKK